MNILFIDTSSNKEMIVKLGVKKKTYVLRQKIGLQKAQIILPMINSLLKKRSIDLREINKINVNTGPGSFTGLRVGISVANTLGTFLKIPINDKKVGALVEAKYK